MFFVFSRQVQHRNINNYLLYSLEVISFFMKILFETVDYYSNLTDVQKADFTLLVSDIKELLLCCKLIYFDDKLIILLEEFVVRFPNS